MEMFRRFSQVGTIKVTGLTFSSVFEIGDSSKISPISKALAVRREVPIFFSNEGGLDQFSIFTRPLPKVAVNEIVTMATYNNKPFINVNAIRIHGVSSSAVFQVGSTNVINAEARVKHIRQLLRQPTQEQED
jgi:spore germination protein PE